MHMLQAQTTLMTSTVTLIHQAFHTYFSIQIHVVHSCMAPEITLPYAILMELVKLSWACQTDKFYFELPNSCHTCRTTHSLLHKWTDLWAHTLHKVHQHHCTITQSHCCGYFTGEVNMAWAVYQIHQILAVLWNKTSSFLLVCLFLF